MPSGRYRRQVKEATRREVLANLMQIPYCANTNVEALASLEKAKKMAVATIMK
jgi:hypothetical protein